MWAGRKAATAVEKAYGVDLYGTASVYINVTVCPDFGNRFGSTGKAFCAGQAEKIAGQKKTGDLPATIEQQFVKLYDAAGHIKYMLGNTCSAGSPS